MQTMQHCTGTGTPFAGRRPSLGTGVPAEGRHWPALGTGVPAEGRHWARECRPKAVTGLHWARECPAEGQHAGARSALSASWTPDVRGLQWGIRTADADFPATILPIFFVAEKRQKIVLYYAHSTLNISLIRICCHDLHTGRTP